MAITANRLYNDPALGQAFSNLASAFGPVSGSDLAGYATAASKKQQNEIIGRLAADPANMGFDMQAILADLYDPTQSFKKVGMDDVTTRRGQDITASTTLATNDADNERALIETVMQSALAPVSQDASRPTFNPADWGVAGPAIPKFDGPRSPLSETQQLAAERQALAGSGTLTDQMLLEAIVGKEAPLQIMGENGPRYSTPGGAVLSGATPYDKPTGSVETQNYKTTTGATGSARFDPTVNDWRDTATGQRLPPGTVTYSAGLTGDAAGTGLGPTVANTTAGNQMEATLNGMDADADAMIALLQNNPGIAGLPGTIFGTAQNAVSVLGEMSSAFGDMAPEARISAEQAQQALSQIAPTRNPAIQQYNLGLTNLAYRLAQMNNPSGEVSRQAFERSMESLSGGMLGNNQSALEAMQALKAQVARNRENVLGTLRNPGQGGTSTGGDAELPVVNTPEEAAQYPSGTQFKDPQGNIRTVP